MRGRIKKFSPGSSKPGEPTEQEISYGLSYYKLVIDGVTVIEIDLVNNVYMVLGIDRESDVRAAMGY
jgi:P2 family phage contractile tail tube protein